MNRIHKQLGIGALFFMFFMGVYFLFSFFSQPSSPPLVAISNWSNPTKTKISKTPIYKGILEGLKEKGYADINLISENAQGSMTQAIDISKKIKHLKPKIIISIGTSMSQVLLSASTSQKIPLIFTAVTDPKKAKLAPHPSRLVTGVSDFMPINPQLEFFKKLFPHLKKIGFIYNKNEANSIIYLEHIMEELEKFPFSSLLLIKAPLASTDKVETVIKSLAGKVDVIYFSNDNTARDSSSQIIKTALRYHLPVLANNARSVEEGALAALAYDEFQMGVKTGHLAAQVLDGKIPGDLPVILKSKISSVINTEVAQKFSVDIPEDLKKESILING